MNATTKKTNTIQEQIGADALPVATPYWRDPSWYASHIVVLAIALGVGYWWGKKHKK